MSRQPISDEKLIEAVELYDKLKNQAACAKQLNISQPAFSLRLSKARARGYSPSHDMDHMVPEGYAVTGTSTLYDKKTGEPKIQWIKTSRQKECEALQMQAIADVLKEDMPRVKPLPAPIKTHTELCNEYIITDYHYGMLAWKEENFDSNWDTKIAGDLLWKSFQKMVDDSPAAETAVIVNLGDFIHSDSMYAVTPSHGHILDQDGRIAKIVREATNVFRKVIDYSLQKHNKVHVVMAEGNHDPYTSVWLRLMFDTLYENEPRLTVDTSNIPYYVHTHGDVMLAYHHGHKKQMATLPLFFAAQYPTVWGETKYRYAATGHRHHAETKEKEYSGMIIQQYQTLSSRDAYASHGGFLSERSVTSNCYHTKHGKVATHIFRPEMFDE